MRILYLSLSYIPSRRASAVHVMKMCSALARSGHDVTLVTKCAPSRQEPGVEDEFAFYGVAPEFTLLKLPRPVWKGGGLLYLWHVNRLLSKQQPPSDLVYSRDLASALLAGRRGLPLVFEAHGAPAGALSRWLWRQLFSSPHLRRLVVISKALQRRFADSVPPPDELEVIVAHDAADPLQAPSSAVECDLESFRGGGRHYGYIGQLHPGKGMELLIPLAAAMPHDEFHVIGGNENDLQHWRRAALPENLRLHGFVRPAELPSWYRRFDALLLPAQREVYGASRRSPIGDFMSPMKLFEYMAAGKPIVSSDLPVLREVLRHRKNALLVPPDDAEAWKEALEKLAAEPSMAHDLAKTALRNFLNQHTWDARAAAVLAGL